MCFFHIIATISLTLVLQMKLTPYLSGFLLFVFGFCLGVYMLAFAIGNRINSVAIAATVAALINTGEPLLGGIFDPLIGHFLDKSWNGMYINSDNVITHVADGAHRYFSVSAYHSAFTILIISMVVAFFMLLVVRDKSIRD